MHSTASLFVFGFRISDTAYPRGAYKRTRFVAMPIPRRAGLNFAFLRPRPNADARRLSISMSTRWLGSFDANALGALSAPRLCTPLAVRTNAAHGCR